MNATQLLAYFDRLSEAPDAVPRLRRFILDLAVRGKLVEQDANDEPARKLVKRIEVEMARLVKANEIRKAKPLPPIDVEEEPYVAPAGWAWVRIRQVTSDRGQTTPAHDFTYIDVTAINKEIGCIGETKVLSTSDAPSRARKVVRNGDVLYSCVRPTLLNIAVVDREIVPAPIASTAFAVLNGFDLVLAKYLWIVLRSPYLEAIVEAGMRGQAYPAINDAEFALLPLALPPLAEQHRIVAKVAELMALCDQLEAAQQERERRRDRLAAASLQRLNQPADSTDPETQREHTRFHLHHLPRLTTRPEHIKALRQTILNLAVLGSLSESKDWALHSQPLKAAATLQNGYAFKSEWFTKTGIRLLRNTNVSHGVIRWDELACLPVEQAGEFERFKLIEGDVVLSLDRPFIGTGTKVARVQATDLPCLLLQRVGRFQLNPNLLTPDYLFLWIESPQFTDQIDPGRSNGVPHISSKQVESAEIFLPPLAEQHRIVAKVDELMALCDQLEAQLTTTQTDSRRLLEAVLDAALVKSRDASIATS